MANIQLFPEILKYCWLGLLAVQLLPVVVKVPIGVQLLANSTLVVAIGVLKSVDVQKDKSEEGDQKESRRVNVNEAGQGEESIKRKDALMFPITASISLFVLYLLFTYINKDLIKVLLKIYFSYLGMYVLGLFLADQIIERDQSQSVLVFERNYGWKIPYLMSEPFSVSFRRADLAGFAVGFVIASVYVFTNNWLLNNLFGICFAVGGIRLLKLNTIEIGFIMLWGLFLYDIFWVFKTDVMVTVAKSVDGPIMLKFPIDIAENKFSMLGLGDMIIPGAFISILFKFDVDNYFTRHPQASHHEVRAPFMWYNLAFYLLGIFITYIFMVVFNHAQPALLYLVPAATLGFLIPAVQRSGFKGILEILQYKVDDDEEGAETTEGESKPPVK
jgi:minor histocompatibility antigen H13